MRKRENPILDRFLIYPLEMIPYVVLTLAAAFTVHEVAHAYVAYKFGDETAKRQGRLTLNPLKHLDPFGTILIFLMGFGWAKPVPVNRFYFKKPRLAGVLVSIAGPISNLILALLGFILILLSAKLSSVLPSGFYLGLVQFLTIWINLNLLLFLFNLLPFPPLDGFRVIQDVVAPDLRAKLTKYEAYGSLVFLIIVITPLGQYVFWPFLNDGRELIISIFNSVFRPLM
ncbi:site-2 protease family protein [Bacillus swezeyi]|uniref:Site-2 protease family protein n=1 Tax=Bacillus swezeyi TaxID=1925020 RepID=A0A1R1QX41_9BACI|nr:site-2 protease family protein [Bacillus swezeyi]MEC1259225.1 site-2 protease family protein [Bacillus swezeyi]MED1740551.1 site-2 protease family protein [Bacillus swezeyi]MED2927814.1 site-2 protease family protein [Bacillus swezeyi]MED2965274.1 site-2 protease family protein [Bacillus swezeyi]MED3071535.1 site-2 protease family protein [Bacillus swezeyi]